MDTADKFYKEYLEYSEDKKPQKNMNWFNIDDLELNDTLSLLGKSMHEKKEIDGFH
jgi:hypothetical protein